MRWILPFLCIGLLAGCSRGGWFFTSPSRTENTATGLKGNATFTNHSPHLAEVHIDGVRKSLPPGGTVAYDGLSGFCHMKVSLSVSGTTLAWRSGPIDADKGYSMEFR